MTRTELTSRGRTRRRASSPASLAPYSPFLEDHLDLIPEGALDTLECLPGPPRR